MSDILHEIEAVRREVGSRTTPDGEARSLVLRRSYDAAIEDLWDALTDGERISRWLLPVTGDLRLGGRYQLEGNAGGTVVACEPPKALTVTWEYGPDPAGLSEVEVRLSAGADGRTELELEHVAVVDDEMWTTYGPGAVGIGWDLSLLGLTQHLQGVELSAEEKAAIASDPAAREFLAASGKAWGAAHEAAGAPADQVATSTAAAIGFYVPDLTSQG